MGRSIACYRHGCDHHGTPWKYELPALHQLGKVNTRLVKNEIIGNSSRCQEYFQVFMPIRSCRFAGR